MRRPVRAWTSNARWMRCASCGRMRAAASGSRCASSACSAAQPCARPRASIPARTRASASGNGAMPVRQRPEIEHRAADQQRHACRGRGCRRSPRARRAAKAPGGIRLARVADVDQVMRHGAAFRRRRLRRADVHAPIHVRRVHAHDLERIAPGQRQRERRLAGARRSHQADRVRGTSVARAGHVAARRHRPRRNRRSSSSMRTKDHVGRPCTHWSLRTVRSISRSSAFISGIVRRRLARTAW